MSTDTSNELEWIPSKKGGLKVIHEGYMYTIHKKQLTGATRWRCCQRTLYCKGSISTGNGPVRVNKQHNHPPEIEQVFCANPFKDPLELVATVDERDKDHSKTLQSDCGKLSSATEKSDSDNEEVCLRWNSHHSNMKMSFPSLLLKEQYVDCTVSSEGQNIKCHRLILSSCSTYFEELLNGISPLQHPVIFLGGISFWVLKALIDFMYSGEVHIEQSQLDTLLKAAEMLKIKGLTGKVNPQPEEKKPTSPTLKTPEPSDEIPSTSKASAPKRVLSPTLGPAIDPLSLLEPTFFEENPVPLRFKEHNVKKPVAKTKVKKRKSSEHETSPPPMLYRKGTKSRPHVKIPRHYRTDFEGLKGTRSKLDCLNLTDVKIESLIIEQTTEGGNDRRKSNPKEISLNKIKNVRNLEKSDETPGAGMKDTDTPIDVSTTEIKQEQIDIDYGDVDDAEKNVT